MINTTTALPAQTLFGSAAQNINKTFSHLANLVTSVARFIGRIITPKQDMAQPATTDFLSKITPQSFNDRLTGTTIRASKTDLNLREAPQLAQGHFNSVTGGPGESDSKKPFDPPIEQPHLVAVSTQDAPANPLPLPQAFDPSATDRSEVPAQNIKPGPLPNSHFKLENTGALAPQVDAVNELACRQDIESKPKTSNANNSSQATVNSKSNKRQKIVLCEHDAGKSPHFITCPKKVLNKFIARISKDYQLALPEIALNDKDKTPIEKLFEKLIDNLCEPWAHNDTLKSWDLHHITEQTRDDVDKALFDIDAEAASPELATSPKAGDGIFTTNKQKYLAIIKVLTDQLSALATDSRDTIQKLKSDMADPNFWRDLVIEAPKVGKADCPDRKMFETLANTFQQYYSHDTIGEGLEDIKLQVKNNKPFLATVHHTANTTEITPFHQALDNLVKTNQPKDCPYDNNRAVRTLAHSTFHQFAFFQKIMDGSGTLTATQNVSRAMLSNKEAQGIICATGGTPEAKRPAEKRHTTHWRTINGEQRNGLASLSIDTQTPVSVVTCVNADELYDVKPNEKTEKIYKESRTSAIDAVSKLNNNFFMQLGWPNPFRIMFSAPLPLKSHASALISPPPALKPDDFASYEDFDNANHALATAFSHHLESHQQEQIFFDLAFTHRDDLGSRRKTQYLIYKMLDALIKTDDETAKTGLELIDGPVAGLKKEYHKFQLAQKEAGLPDSHNTAFSAEIMRTVYRLADAYKYPTEFFSSKLCKSVYMDTLCHVEEFERHLSFEERETQKAWFDTFNSIAISAFLKRNYQYFGEGLSNNLYLLGQLFLGVAKKSAFGAGI